MMKNHQTEFHDHFRNIHLCLFVSFTYLISKAEKISGLYLKFLSVFPCLGMVDFKRNLLIEDTH